MIRNITYKLENLPLSWVYNTTDKARINSLPLFWKKSVWLTLGEIDSFNSLRDYISAQQKQGYNHFLRGLNLLQINELEKLGFEILPAGQEAILDLSQNHFQKKSLRKLIKRGNRFGKVKEYEYSNSLKEKVEIFRQQSVHGCEPKLKHLYHTEFVEGCKLFTFENENNWLALIVVSSNSKDKFHLELMLRKKDTPIGVMESLIEKAFYKLKETNKKYFSLGEVPLLINNELKINSKGKFIITLGKIVSKFYNYHGLYNFKKKFNPIWEDVYIASDPKIKILDLVAITIRTQLFLLSITKFFRGIICFFRR